VPVEQFWDRACADNLKYIVVAPMSYFAPNTLAKRATILKHFRRDKPCRLPSAPKRWTMAGMKLALVGSRTFTDRALMAQTVAHFVERNPVREIVTGGAAGADALAEEVARDLALPVTVVRADWRRYGAAAGPIRNAEVVRLADAAIAFVDKPLIASKGTNDVVCRFRRAGKPVEVVQGPIAAT